MTVDASSSAFVVTWRTDMGFGHAVTEYDLELTNASDDNKFDDLYVRTAGTEIQEIYWREYNQPALAQTHELAGAATSSDGTLTVTYPGAVTDYVGP